MPLVHGIIALAFGAYVFASVILVVPVMAKMGGLAIEPPGTDCAPLPEAPDWLADYEGPPEVPRQRVITTVVFVPLDDFPVAVVEELAAYYRARWKVHVEVAEPTDIDPIAWKEGRRQLSAELVIGQLAKGQSGSALRSVDLIGFTTQDMYGGPYQWVFSWRDGWSAVISTCNLNPQTLKRPPNVDLTYLRLRKATTRQIGFGYFGLESSGKPGSVVRDKMGGLDDLDRANEDF